MIHRIEAVAARLPVCAQAYQAPSMKQTTVNRIEPL